MHSIHNPGWDMHLTMRDPMQDLGGFMHGCAKDPVTRVMSTAALVLALCQTAGPAMISEPPGFLLINAGNDPVDPIDGLMKGLIGTLRPRPRPKTEEFERNRRTMKVLLIQQQQQQARNPLEDFFSLTPSYPCPLGEKFQSLLAENHGGSGRAGWYADRRDEDYGWVTDASGHSILRLDRDEDRRQLREDVRVRPQLLTQPSGCGANMRSGTKKLSIAGSLPAADWDGHLADGVVCRAIPVLFLPHSATLPLVTPGDLAMEWIGIALAGEAVRSLAGPVEACPRLDPINLPWLKHRLAGLRKRLIRFPADYEFFVMRTVREMLPCCCRLVRIVAPGTTPDEEQRNLTFDLFAAVLQGLSLGVESLGWHGYGFDNAGSAAEARRVLGAIRERGSVSRRELQRNQQWLTAGKRDEILTALAAEGLIKIVENEVTALPFADYWQRIIHRSFGKMPEPLWQGAPRAAGSGA